MKMSIQAMDLNNIKMRLATLEKFVADSTILMSELVQALVRDGTITDLSSHNLKALQEAQQKLAEELKT